MFMYFIIFDIDKINFLCIYDLFNNWIFLCIFYVSIFFVKKGFKEIFLYVEGI